MPVTAAIKHPMPEIKFIRPGPIPFRMDVSISPDLPAVISGTPLPPESHEYVRGVIQRELDRYPPGLLAQPKNAVVTRVFLVDRLSINNVSGLGAYLAGGIAFVSAGAPHGQGLQDDVQISRTLHHELSSLFRFAYPLAFDEKRFREANPPGFVYADERPGADPAVIFGGVNVAGNLDDLSNGIIAEYATRCLAQDFNSYAEVLLWKPELLLETFAPGSRVGRKARVVRDFYIAIDPRFEAYFAPKGEKPQ